LIFHEVTDKNKLAPFFMARGVYSAGRPSCWPLAHILVLFISICHRECNGKLPWPIHDARDYEYAASPFSGVDMPSRNITPKHDMLKMP